MKHTLRSYGISETKELIRLHFQSHLPIATEESKEINFETEPMVIISASRMCEAGRIRHHLKHNLWNQRI